MASSIEVYGENFMSVQEGGVNENSSYTCCTNQGKINIQRTY